MARSMSHDALNVSRHDSMANARLRLTRPRRAPGLVAARLCGLVTRAPLLRRLYRF